MNYLKFKKSDKKSTEKKCTEAEKQFEKEMHKNYNEILSIGGCSCKHCHCLVSSHAVLLHLKVMHNSEYVTVTRLLEKIRDEKKERESK